MRRLLTVLFLAASATVHAAEVVDDFESGSNPNQWGWSVSGSPFTIQPDGGNPGAWMDSGVPYMTTHANLTAVPPQGSALRVALASGTLAAARIDFEQLDTTGVAGCFPRVSGSGPFTLKLFDLHSSPDGSLIEAHTLAGPPTPVAPFPWQTASFTIPSASTDVPPGWKLNAGGLEGYTWSTLMKNIDGISFYPGNPYINGIDGCWHLGADNVVVTYADAIFADGFEGGPSEDFHSPATFPAQPDDLTTLSGAPSL